MLSLPSQVAVLGAGVSGQSIVEYLIDQGVNEICLCDSQESPLYHPSDARVRSQFGTRWLEGIDQYPLVFRSPGIPPFHPDLRHIHPEKMTTATSWFMRQSPAPITAITGSAGKSTTVALLFELLKAEYGDLIVRGGNDAKPLLDHLPLLTPQHRVLLELSSFQLEDIDVSPHIAVLLNISRNHLDWHPDMPSYIAAKSRIFRFQGPSDLALVNRGDSYLSAYDDLITAKKHYFGSPSDAADLVYIENDVLCIDAKPCLPLAELTCKTDPDNILAASLAAQLHDVSTSRIVQVLKEFRGIPDRLEFLRTFEGISFYNDSASTTPASTLSGLRHFDPKQLVIMLGGRDKGMDYDELFSRIVDLQIRVYIYGEMGEVFEKNLNSLGAKSLIINKHILKAFPDIVEDAISCSLKGDLIMFSPACTSFDMFKNAKERGKLFREVVMGL